MSSQIRIFHAALSQFHPDLAAYLPPSERNRLSTYKHPKRRQLFVLGRALLAQALAFLGEDGNYSISYLKQGKPVLRSPKNWHFNLTHSGEHLLLALCQRQHLGIDSEIIKPRKFQAIAEKVFPKHQQQAIADAADPLLTFYKYWTQYEAQIKQRGLSVFAQLPDSNDVHLKSYQRGELVYALCSKRPIGVPNTYQYRAFSQPTFTEIVIASLD